MKRSWSLARQLMARLTFGLMALWLLCAVGVGLALRHEVGEVFDSALQETAQRLLPLAIEELDDHDDKTENREVRTEVEAHEEYLVYQVRGGDGRILIRSHDAPARPFAAALTRGFAEAGGWRIYTERAKGGRLFIQVAEPTRHRDKAIVEMLIWLIAPLALLVPLAGLLVFDAVRRAIKPIGGLGSAIRARGGADLEPIEDAGLPDELAPIVSDVNRLLDRLSSALEAERSFAANSAHELRTPVAAALAQLQRLERDLAGRPEAARVTQIAGLLRRLGDLVEKLLQLARAEAGIAMRREPVDLAAVTRLVAEDFARSGRFADRLEVSAESEEPVIVEADLDAVAIALRNLIENALMHGPSNGKVTVHVAASRSVHVVNGGPPVPPERLAALKQRFARGATRAAGSGLGLAIADTIARQIGGSLVLLSPASGRLEGFEAVLDFSADPYRP